MKAYLDTNAFLHLYNRVDCTGEDIAALRKAIYGGRLSIRLGTHNLEEILLGHTASPQTFSAQVRLVLSLATSRMLVKPCNQLLLDDIRAYASKGGTDSPFMHGPQQNAVSSGIAEFIETDGEEIDDDFRDVLESTRHQKEEFRDKIRRSSEDLEEIEKTHTIDRITFDQYRNDSWERLARKTAENHAKRAGVLGQCQQRGIDRLLELRSVRATLEIGFSYQYGIAYEGHAPAIGNSRDLHHVVSAATSADTFVTDDKRLRYYASRMKLDSFEVIDLRTFLSRASAPAE